MADIADTIPISPSDVVDPQQIEISGLWGRIALGAIALLAIFMNFFQLGQNGYGNLYYAAGVRSMSDSWHNFFFVSFDPGGFVTIDKPPLGFWLQALSSKILGFTAFSIFLPQALCGVLAVVLLYYLVRRHFGVVAGLISALALAVTPISVVTNRNNTIDGTLAFVLLLAAWAVIHAAETGKLRWLLLTAIFVGLGFNVKMAEAYLVVPALGLTYFLCAPHNLWTRIWHLLLALLVMLMLSLSWAAIVDLTPPAQRPYVGSTQSNSEIDLAFGYNGLSRLRIGTSGRNGFGGSARNIRGDAGNNDTQTFGGDGTTNAQPLSARAESPSLPGAAGGNGFGGAFQTGAIGPFHLFSSSLGGQIAWMLTFALFGLVALAWQRRFRFQVDRQQLGFVLWGAWLLTMAIFFSADGSFHQYYMTEMAPGLSALVGIGLVMMWHDYRGLSWHGWLLPITLAVTGAVQIYLLTSYPSWSLWLSPLIGIVTAGVVSMLVLFRLRPQLDVHKPRFSSGGVLVNLGVLILLVAPAIWSGYSVIYNLESSFPMAGPNAQSSTNSFFGARNTTDASDINNRLNRANTAGGAPFGGGNAFSQVDTALISYLTANQGTTTYLVATPSAMTADAVILSTNKPVMAMGGFGGGDPILTTSTLEALIKDGTIRFFMLNGPSRRGFGFGNASGFRGSQQSNLTTWITGHCNAVQINKAPTSTIGNTQLYDCASLHP